MLCCGILSGKYQGKQWRRTSKTRKPLRFLLCLHLCWWIQACKSMKFQLFCSSNLLREKSGLQVPKYSGLLVLSFSSLPSCSRREKLRRSPCNSSQYMSGFLPSQLRQWDSHGEHEKETPVKFCKESSCTFAHPKGIP